MAFFFLFHNKNLYSGFLCLKISKDYVSSNKDEETLYCSDNSKFTHLSKGCFQTFSASPKYVPKLGTQQVTRIKEAAAIAFYHQQTDCPVVQTLCCDDAPQFKLITADRALCWVHEGRHYKKLSPVFHCHQVILEQFVDDFWDYYRELLAYKDAPIPEVALLLRSKFRRLFETPSGYELLDERKQLTATKVSELLRVLEHPELPLHNNPAELAARTCCAAT